MNLKIIGEKENPLMHRKELVVEIEFDGATPKLEEMRNAISSKLGANPELLVVRKTKNFFGVRKVNVEVHLYSTREDLLATEPEYLLKRNKLIEEKKAEEKKEEKGEDQ